MAPCSRRHNSQHAKGIGQHEGLLNEGMGNRGRESRPPPRVCPRPCQRRRWPPWSLGTLGNTANSRPLQSHRCGERARSRRPSPLRRLGLHAFIHRRGLRTQRREKVAIPIDGRERMRTGLSLLISAPMATPTLIICLSGEATCHRRC